MGDSLKSYEIWLDDQDRKEKEQLHKERIERVKKQLGNIDPESYIKLIDGLKNTYHQIDKEGSGTREFWRAISKLELLVREIYIS
jgi:hypothetical protein